MTRARVRTGLLGAAIAAVLAAAPALAEHSGAGHKLHRAAPPLPHSLAVDEQEWSIILSQKVVAAGIVHLTDYNRGQDPHDITIRKGQHIVAGPDYVQPGQSTSLSVRLAKGSYVVYCSMFMGTSESHYAKGMHTVLTVR